MIYPNVGMYRIITDVQSRDTIPLDFFLRNIQNGHWQDLILPIRATRDKEARKQLKDKLPSVTVSGTFDGRYDNKLVQHSGFMAVDFDDLGVETEGFKDAVSRDPYTYAAFVSCSGYGVCVIIKIEPDRHNDAYLGAAAYFLERYKKPADPTGINISRPRFVSFDPGISFNENSLLFKKYLPKEKKHKPPPVVFVQTEFDDVVRQIIERRVGCCEDYRDWLRVCFGLCNRFGERGRSYFHALSAISNKYSTDICDKQYTAALKHEVMWAGNKATLSTIYYYAKLAGINISSPATQKISAQTTALKKSGLSKELVIKNLEQFGGVPAAESSHIVEQAYDSGYDFHNDKDNLIDSLLAWLQATYSLRRNCITRKIENDGRAMEDCDTNTIFLQAKKVFDDLSFDMFNRVVYSHFIPTYNPFQEWWQNNQDAVYNDEILKFWRCINCSDKLEWERMVYFGTKWLVSIVSSIYGNPSPLLFILAGERHGSGKTRVFRKLFPQAWRSPVDYYAESRLDGKEADDAILMCSKLLIMDDEFEGKSKKEQKRIKALTDKDTFSVREPYGRIYADRKRLAVLAGTCNELEMLNDPTGKQRRLIPVHIQGVDYETMNKIDRVAMWAELFRMFHAGFNWEVIKDDIEILHQGADKFTEFSLEYELINNYYELPENTINVSTQELTAGQIKEHIDKLSNQRTSLNKIGQELKRIGFAQQIKKLNGRTSRVYTVIERRTGGASGGAPPLMINNPF